LLPEFREDKRMADEFRVSLVDDPEDSAVTAVGFGIRDFNLMQAGENNYRRLCVFVHALDNSVIGGLIASTYWAWLYVDLLWVKEEYRSQGHGGRLLSAAEEEARRRGAKQAYLDTFSFQSPGFYLDRGYEVFGELTDFPEGHKRFFLRKRL